MTFDERENLFRFVVERIGKRCVVCGEVVFTQSELSLVSCDVAHNKCVEPCGEEE